MDYNKKQGSMDMPYTIKKFGYKYESDDIHCKSPHFREHFSELCGSEEIPRRGGQVETGQNRKPRKETVFNVSGLNQSQSSLGNVDANCSPPLRIGECKNTDNLKFLPCQDPSVDSMGMQAGIIEYTNRLRANLNQTDGQNRPMLVSDPGLTVGAQWKANDMVQNNYFSHTDLMGRMAPGEADFLRQTDSRIWTNCIAENITEWDPVLTPYEAFAVWFCSTAGHFQNLTNPGFDRVGVGFVPAPSGQFNKWVMWLASSRNPFPFSCSTANPIPTPPCQPGWRKEGGNWVYYQRNSSGNCVKQTGWVFDNEPGDMLSELRIFTYAPTHNYFWIDPNTQAWSRWVWNDIDKTWWEYRTDKNWYQYQCDQNGQNCQVVQQTSAGPFR